MKEQPNRLDSRARHFAGHAIIRSRPIHFRLNGRTMSGFEGDTVLSAALASGYDTAGIRGGWPLALSARHAPPIVPIAQRHDLTHALPMERTPATNGAQYATLGAGSFSHLSAAVARFKPARSLGLDLDDPGAMHQPWLDGTAEPGPDADMVVIGGGIAGMTAALASAKAGLRVTMVEASLALGGYARLFGAQEGEEAPDQSIARLVTAIAQDHTISVMLGTRAIAARPGSVRVHAVSLVHGVPTGRTLDLHPRFIIIATGVIERLPIFAGNRLPGVSSNLENYHFAEQFGVWPGKSAVFTTVANTSYRLAMLASDAGIQVSRIMDGRAQPQSRFIEFAKAYGITMAVATLTGEAKPAPKSRGLSVTPQSSLNSAAPAEAPLLTDGLVVCGGWQPELTLWHMAGGESRWSAQGKLEPILKGPTGVALAGSAAGFLSGYACLRSGKAAVAQVLNRRSIPVDERLIDPIYETPDDPTPFVRVNEDASAPAYLDVGQSYIERPQQKRSRWPAWVPFGRTSSAWSLADMPRTLALADIAAGTQLGAIPAESAGIVAQERVALIAIPVAEAAEPRADQPSQGMPSYLLGRYGDDPAERAIAAMDGRRLEVGALIYADADQTDPLRSIGVVMRIKDGQTLALLASATAANASAFVREGSRAIPIRINQPEAQPAG